MEELLTLFKKKYKSVLGDLKIGYSIDDLDICGLWSLMATIHFIENAQLTEDEVLNISKKFVTKRYFN